MSGLFGKAQVLTCILLLAMIAAFEYGLHAAGLPTWPVFLTMVTFFTAEQKVEKIPHVVVGAMFGILNVWVLLNLWLPNLGFMGMFNAQILYVMLFVGSIAILQPVVPKLLNTYTFLFFLVAALGAGGGNHWIWIAEVPTAGLLTILGCIGLNKLVASLCAPAQGMTEPTK